VRYVWQAARDTYKKKTEITRLRKLIVVEQQKLDRVLSTLGRQARAADLGLPALADEMRAAKTLEAEREASRARIGEQEQKRALEIERFRGVETEQQAAIARADQVVTKLSEDLAARISERAGHRAGMNRLDGQLKSLARQAQAKEADAVKAVDPTSQGVLRGEVDVLRVQIAALEPERAKFAQRASDLDAPIAELEAQVTSARDEASRLKRDLGEASRAHQTALAAFAAEIEAEQRRIAASDRELSLKFVTLGTILNLNRVAGDTLDPLYREFDEVKGVITEHEDQIVRLESEIRSYDRSQLQKGVITLAAGLLLLIIVTAIIVH
jgi:chromosome segregation ATPase